MAEVAVAVATTALPATRHAYLLPPTTTVPEVQAMGQSTWRGQSGSQALTHTVSMQMGTALGVNSCATANRESLGSAVWM
jgi:hypothetical protein